MELEGTERNVIFYTIRFHRDRKLFVFHEAWDLVFGEPNNILYGRSGEQATGKECEGNGNGNMVTEAF